MKNWTIIFCTLGIAFILLTNISYINYAWHATDGYRYTGANVYAASDKLVYMSMIQQGREGILFMKNLHTTLPQQGMMLSPHWYIIGQTARILHISNNAAYQLYRIVLTVLFLLVVYRLLVRLFSREWNRVVAAMFILFSSGLGWLYTISHPEALSATKSVQKFLLLPIDFYVTEGMTFLNFAQAPLFALSQLMILGVFYIYIQDREKSVSWKDWLNGVAVALLGIIHPYDLPIIAFVLGSWTVWYLARTYRWMILVKSAILAIGAIVAAGYSFYAFRMDPVLAGWYSQNLVYSPPLSKYIWGYGLLIFFWLIGSVVLVYKKRNDPWWMLLLIWSFGIWIMLYLPLTINRRFINGFHIPLAIIASVGGLYLFKIVRFKLAQIAFIIVTAIGLLGGTIFYLTISTYFDSSMYTYGYYYITPAEHRLLSFLETSTTPHDALLISDAKTSFTITGQLDRIVFRGHDHQTPQSHLKQEQLDWFFADQGTLQSASRKSTFLKANNLEYVIVNHEHLSVPAMWLSSAPFLNAIYRADQFEVFKVNGNV